jgi:type II secretory pathway component HofQ
VGNVLAQSDSNQCENYGKKDFKGKSINLNVVDTDLKNILNNITDEFGCNFIFDKVDNSILKINLTVNFDGIPWNIALDKIIKDFDLKFK